jgi:para-nitrobenzyl esterase
LFLNLWAPARLSGNLPVLVWFHGGGHVSGTNAGGSSGVAFDGQYFLEHFGVMVVTVEYRLDVLGYLAHPALDAESPQGVSGNYGFLDEIAALQWIQRNIVAFGGDPTRVTLFGMSAGGEDIGSHLVSPLSKGLFSGVILESPAVSFDAIPTLAQLEQTTGAQVAAAAECASEKDVAACLRALTLDKLIPAVPGISSTIAPGNYGPVIDGYVLPAPPLDIIVSGAHNQVPVLIGTNGDETYLNTVPGSIPDEATYISKLHMTFGKTGGDLVLAQYPVADYPSPERAYVTVTTDNTFTCPVRTMVRTLVDAQNAPVFRYLLTHTWGSGTPQSQRHAYHGIELPFVWHSFAALTGYTPSESEIALADSITGYWARFATYGDPNGFEATFWPAALNWYDDIFLQLDDTIVAGRGVRAPNCAFWDAHAKLSIFRGSKLD